MNVPIMESVKTVLVDVMIFGMAMIAVFTSEKVARVT